MDGLLVMLPSMMILLVLSEQAAPEPQFARVLSLAPVLFFAFRHGWRGASLAMIISSFGMTLVDQHLGHAPSTAAAYLFLAVAGTGALMLGSATDALRRSSERVAEQNVYLGAVNRRLDQLAQQLRSAARGNLQADENQRRHLAAELARRAGPEHHRHPDARQAGPGTLAQAGMEDISTSINTILAHMRRALHRLLDDLRPAVLDEFGLLRALDEGPIRDLLNAAGVRTSPNFTATRVCLTTTPAPRSTGWPRKARPTPSSMRRPANSECACASASAKAWRLRCWICATTVPACPAECRAVAAACKACAIGSPHWAASSVCGRPCWRSPANFVARQQCLPDPQRSN
jgi:hypothetical protein